jgi:hypothetical protein
MKHINFHVLCLATFIAAAIALGFAVSHAGTVDATRAESGPSSMLTPFGAALFRGRPASRPLIGAARPRPPRACFQHRTQGCPRRWLASPAGPIVGLSSPPHRSDAR